MTSIKNRDELGSLQPYVDAIRKLPSDQQTETAQRRLLEQLASKPASKRFSPWRWFPATVTAAAVAIVIGFILPNSGQLAFADVIDNLNQVRSFHAVTRVLMGEQTVTTVTSDFAEPGLVRIELPGNTTTIMDTNAMTMVTLMHHAKAYMSMTVGQPNMTLPATPENQALEWLSELKQVQGDADVVYPRKLMNERWVLGFGVTRDNIQMTVWADEIDGLPVSLEVLVNQDGQTLVTTQADYEFNVNFDADHFSLDVPEGYRILSESND